MGYLNRENNYGGDCGDTSAMDQTERYQQQAVRDGNEILRLERENANLKARLAAAQKIADGDRVDHPIYGLGEEFESPGWRSKLGRDLHQALNSPRGK